MREIKIIEDAACTFCGCVCDDITLKVEANRITEAKRACVLGKAWFMNHEKEWFEQFYSISFSNYPVDSSYVHQSEPVGRWQEGKKH